MSIILACLLAVFVLFFLVIGYYYFRYLGYFTRVNVTTIEIDEMNIAFLNFDSPFRNMHIAYSLLIKRLRELLGKDWEPSSCVYIYYSDPLDRSSTSVSWCVGTILNDSERDLLSNFPDQISVTTLPASQTLCTSFPFRNMLSYGIGAKKGFDALYDCRDSHHIYNEIPPIEIHNFDVNEDIFYYLYLSNEEYFVDMVNQPHYVLT